MKFTGTSRWTNETGGYEFRLSEDGTLVHLHDADLVKVDYRRDIGQLRLFFRYDQEFAEGLLRDRPFLALSFGKCTILEWQDHLFSCDVTTDGPDLSVKLLDVHDGNTIVFESVPVRIRFSTDEVQVVALTEMPPDELP